MFNRENIAQLQEQADADGVQKLIAGAFIVKDGEFLIVKRASTEDFMAGFDEVPSGHVDEGETIDEALTREVYEETGLVISDIVTYSNSFDYTSGSGKKSRQYNFVVEVEDGEITLNPAEHSEYKWIDPKSSEFKSLNLSDETRKCIADANKKLKNLPDPQWVVLDGVDAVGKSTQLDELKKKLEGRVAIETLPEFSNSEVGDLIRENIRLKEFFALRAPGEAIRTETALLIADTLFKAEYEVARAPADTDLVLSDRGLVSLIAYQAIRVAEGELTLDEAEEWLNDFVNVSFSNTKKPDLNIILTLPLEDIVARVEARRVETQLSEADKYLLTQTTRPIEEVIPDFRIKVPPLSEQEKSFLARTQDLIVKVASRPENNAVCIPVEGLTVDELSSKIIATIDSKLSLGLSISESAPRIVRSTSLGSEAFNPANSLIPVGLVQLNKSDPFLSDLPDEARANYLITPRSTAEIFRDGPQSMGTWLKDIVDIRNIGESHGFHYDGQLVTGMQIYDNYEAEHDQPYGRERADVIRAAWEQARESGQNVMSGISIVTPELIRGYSIDEDSNEKVVERNLRDSAQTLNNAIRKQNRENGLAEDEGIIILENDFTNASYQFTSQASKRSVMCSINLADGEDHWGRKWNPTSSSRGGALQVLTPNA